MSYREHYIFHPDDTFLKNDTWLFSQPDGTVETIIFQKNDTYAGIPELAIGEGRYGKNAIRLRSTGRTTTGMGGIWCMPQVSSGGSRINPTNDANLVIPRTKKVNRLETWFRFPPGFRIASAANSATTQNMHWGTYSARPDGVGGNLTLSEEMGPWDGIVHGPLNLNSWHWYHEATIRHDQVDDNEWVRIVFNGCPAHMRQDGGANIPPNSPTHQYGDYFSCLTRFYLDFVPDWWLFTNGTPQPGDPEIDVPFDIYCDTIRFFWHDEYLPCEIRFGPNGDWFEGQEVEVSPTPTNNDIPFRITNVTDASVTGRLAWRGRYEHGPSIIPQAGGSSFNWQSITLAAGETKHYWLRVSPSADDGTVNPDFPNPIGIVFEPSTEFVGVGPTNSDATWGQNRVSKWSHRVHTHAIHGVGGHDYDICSRCIALIKNSGSNTSYRPTSMGGLKYRVPVTVTSQFQLPANRPGGGAMVFTKGASQSGRGTLTISTSGVVTYTPPSAGWEGTCHFSYQINSGDSKQSIWYGAWVNVSSNVRVPIAGANAANSKLLTQGGNLVTLTHGGVY